MSSSDFRDFDTKTKRKVAPAATPAPSKIVAEDENLLKKVALAEFCNKWIHKLDEDEMHRLLSSLPSGAIKHLAPEIDTSKIKISDQIANLILGVDAMTKEVMVNGRIKAGVEVKEANSVFTSCIATIKMLTAMQAEVVNLERLQKVEECILEILRKHFTEEKAKLFIDLLENALAETNAPG